MTDAEAPQVLTIDEVADLLRYGGGRRVRREKVRRLVDDGRLPLIEPTTRPHDMRFAAVAVRRLITGEVA